MATRRPAFNAFNAAMWVCTSVAGADSATSITVTGIAVEDVVLEVVRRDGTSALMLGTNVASEVTVVSANTIQLSTTNTTGNVLEIRYLDVDAREA